MIAELMRGAHCALRGFALVRRPGVWPFAVIPLALNGVILGTALALGMSAFGDFMAWMLPTWLDVALVRAILWVVFALGAVLVAFYAFTLLANVVAAPFNGWLAARVERELRGGEGREGLARGVLAEAVAAVAAELRKLAYLGLWMVPLLALFLIPGVNILAPLAWLVFGAWMMTLEYADYPLGNHGLTFPEARRLLRHRRPAALGFGAVVMALTAVPVVNFLAMPIAVAGAGALYVDELADLVGADADD